MKGGDDSESGQKRQSEDESYYVLSKQMVRGLRVLSRNILGTTTAGALWVDGSLMMWLPTICNSGMYMLAACCWFVVECHRNVF